MQKALITSVLALLVVGSVLYFQTSQETVEVFAIKSFTKDEGPSSHEEDGTKLKADEVPTDDQRGGDKKLETKKQLKADEVPTDDQRGGDKKLETKKQLSYGTYTCQSRNGYRCLALNGQIINDASTYASNPTTDRFCFEHTASGFKATYWQKVTHNSWSYYSYYYGSSWYTNGSGTQSNTCFSRIDCDDGKYYNC